jgi:hypothetical protein
VTESERGGRLPPLPAGEGWGEGIRQWSWCDSAVFRADGVGGMFEGIGVGVGCGNSPPIGVAVGRPYGSRTGWSVEPVPVTFTPPGPGPEPDTDVGPELWQETSARIAAVAQVGLRTRSVYRRATLPLPVGASPNW